MSTNFEDVVANFIPVYSPLYITPGGELLLSAVRNVRGNNLSKGTSSRNHQQLSVCV